MTNPYLTLPRIKAALQALDLRPSRGMGQNFLIDGAALQTIVGAAELAPDQTVVEVGPGLGVLTWELARAAGQVVTVELDRRLAARLHEEFAGAQNLTIVEGDILRHPPEQLLAEIGHPPERPYKLVANLPYAVTSPVLRHFLESAQKPALLVVLVQWEVAQRIAAKAGDLSMLAHAIQAFAEPEVVARVKGASFYPIPAVDSAVLRLRTRPHPALAEIEFEQLMRVIKAGFLHARKTLSNALPGGMAAMGTPTTRETAVAALNAAGVDPQRRAETLTLAEWAAVYRALQ